MTIIFFLCVSVSESNASSRHPKWFIFNWSLNWIQPEWERNKESERARDFWFIWHLCVWNLTPQKRMLKLIQMRFHRRCGLIFYTFPCLFQLYLIEDIYWATRYLHIHSHTHTHSQNWSDGQSKINILNHLNLEFKRMIMIVKSSQLSTFKWLD